MKANYRAAASAGLILSAACADVGEGATTVQTVVGPYATSSDIEILFASPILSVTDLVSISDGAVYTGEGAKMTVSVVLTNEQVVEIFSKIGSPFESPTLAVFTGNAFTDFATPQDIKALRINYSGGQQAGNFSLPGSTVLTFAVVPEPAGAIMAGIGFVFLAGHRRRKIA